MCSRRERLDNDVTPYPAYTDWRAQNRSFQSMAAFATRSLTLGLAGEAGGAHQTWVRQPLRLARCRAAYRAAVPGRRNTPGSTTVVILSDGFWRRRFAGSPAVLGQPFGSTRSRTRSSA